MALLLRRDHGPGDARRDQPPAPRQALLRAAFDGLRHSGLERVHRRHGTARGQRPARDGAIRSRGHLGHQRGGDAGQRDDPRAGGAARAQGADRGDRHLPQRHCEAGGPVRLRAPRHRRRAGLRGNARPVPRRPRGPRLPRALHGLPASAGAPPRGTFARVGGTHHRGAGGDHRDPGPDDRDDPAHLPAPRLRLLPAAQRRGEHARGALHRGGDRRVAPRGRRRVPQQRRDLPLGQVDDRRA